METTTIEVSQETWRQLNYRKEPGESFDDVISGFMTSTIREFESGQEPSLSDWEPAEDGQTCSHFTPDRGGCDDEADVVLTMEYNGKENELPYCEDHANLPDEES